MSTYQQENPAQIQTGAGQTRADLGATAEALAAKTDVKANAKDAAATAKTKVAGSVSSGVEAIKAKASDLAGQVRSADVGTLKKELPRKARGAAVQVRDKAKANPVRFAVAAGLLLLVVVAVRRRSR